MAVADRPGLPLAIRGEAASPHEVTRVATTLAERCVEARPEHLIGDKAYDSDPLDARLAEPGIALVAPPRAKRKQAKTQDGRPLRRYKRRWKGERLFAWLQNFRRVPVRHAYQAAHYLGFVQLGWTIILFRWYV